MINNNDSDVVNKIYDMYSLLADNYVNFDIYQIHLYVNLYSGQIMTKYLELK